MKQIVIICHDFPPLKSVAAIRPAHWLEHLSDFGIRPIVFTRSWSENVLNHNDKFNDEKTLRKHESNDNWELYTIPIKDTWKIRFIRKYGLEKFSAIRRSLTMIDWIKYYFTISKDEFSPIFSEVNDFLSQNKVDAIIVSGSPFHFFKYGYYFKNKFNINWVPDYRDEWFNNHSREEMKSLNVFQQIELHFEKKWTSNANAFTSVSEGLVRRISSLIKKKGCVIRNGFDENKISGLRIDQRDKFEVTYAGTIYNSAYLEILEDGIKAFYENCNGSLDIQFNFIGIDLNKTIGTERIHQLKSRYPNWINIIPSMDYRDCMGLIASSSATLSLIAGSISEGIVQTKIYDYLAMNKLILNIESRPSNQKHEFSDHVLDCRNADEFSENLQLLFKKWGNKDILSNNLTKSQLETYSRSKQTEKFAKFLSTIIEENE